MKEIHWKIIDISWFLAFEILLAFALKIPILGLIFLPLALLFLKFFSITVVKFGSSWIVWSIPYTLLSVFFLSFFSGENVVTFTFKTFWLSLSSWFSPPISSFAMASVFFVITYVIGYLIANILKGTSNSYIALAVSAIVAGMATQYCCLLVSLGFMLLFLTSFLLSLKMKKKHISRNFAVVLFLLFAIGVAFFAIGSTHQPFTPLNSFIPHHTPPATASIASSESSKSPYSLTQEGKISSVKIPRASSRNAYAENANMENLVFQIIIYVVGISILGIGFFFIVAFFKMRKKRKRKSSGKNLLLALWLIISILFVFMIVTYLFNITGNLMERGKVNTFASSSQPLKIHADNQNIGTNATQTGENKWKNTSPFESELLWISLAVMSLVTILYMILMFLKYLTPSFSKEEKRNVKNEEETFEREKVKELDSFSKPWQVVLFYYSLLRKKIGNPSSTPYEFEKELKNKIDVEGIEKITRIFVKLRYAHQKISEKDAEFVKKWVKNVLRQS